MLYVQLKSTAVALFVLFHCRSQLGRIVGFRHSLTPAENAACCSEYLVLTVRVRLSRLLTMRGDSNFRLRQHGRTAGTCSI